MVWQIENVDEQLLWFDEEEPGVREVYADGTFSDRGVRFYVTPRGNVIKLRWSWQPGESDHCFLIGHLPEDGEAIAESLLSCPHPGRVRDALKALGLEEYEPEKV